LRDDEWELIERLLPPACTGGRARGTDLREVMNAILYLATGSCQWRMLPKDFPPLSTECLIEGDFLRKLLFFNILAETERFELSVPDLPVRRFSKPLVSATHPRLRIAAASAGYSDGFSGRQGAGGFFRAGAVWSYWRGFCRLLRGPQRVDLAQKQRESSWVHCREAIVHGKDTRRSCQIGRVRQPW
jgi:hypothetical protein